MTIGFIDTATINSAAGAISSGSGSYWKTWDKQSLFDVTFLLMHSNIKAVPTMENHKGATGYYQYVVSKFPQLGFFSPETQLKAKNQTNTWLKKNQSQVKDAWVDSLEDPNFLAWANTHREQGFVNHVERHDSLFEPLFLPYISFVLNESGLNCSENELLKLQEQSTNFETVERWAKSNPNSDEIQLVQQAWLLAGMMRGKYHEFLARENKLQLFQHPFRKNIGAKLKTGDVEPVTNSEAYFINIIIASALLEKKSENKVITWLDNIDKARNAISRPTIALPNCLEESQAEQFAFDAAKKINIQSHSTAFRRVLDWTVSVGIGTLVAFTIAPWITPLGVVVAPTIKEAYKQFGGTSFGDDISKHILFTKSRFQKLQETVDGRIERVQLQKPK